MGSDSIIKGSYHWVELSTETLLELSRPQWPSHLWHGPRLSRKGWPMWRLKETALRDRESLSVMNICTYTTYNVYWPTISIHLPAHLPAWQFSVLEEGGLECIMMVTVLKPRTQRLKNGIFPQVPQPSPTSRCQGQKAVLLIPTSVPVAKDIVAWW
jgi:hypothetical protein